VQFSAHGQGIIRIDGAVAFFDVLNDAVLVNHDVGALRPFIGLVLLVIAFENAVGRQHFLVHVAQEREFDTDLFGESGVGCGGIDAYSENFCIGGINLARSDSRLDRLELFGSTTGKGQDVNGEKDIFLAAIVAELYGLPLITKKREVGSSIPHFQADFGDFVFFLRCGRRRGE